MALSNWPALVDDDGSLTLGTEIDKAVFDAIKASIEADLYSTANPSVTAENIIDEVITARGSISTLDGRLDVSLNNDGTLKSQASLVTAADAQTLPQTNTVVNDIFLIWPDGDSSAPSRWTLAGTGAAVARAGTSLADTNRKVGDFCAKLTFGSTTLTLQNDILTTAAFSRLSHLQQEVFGFGVWIKSAVASQVRVYITDGVTTTYTSYHTGDNTWQWLSTTHTVSDTATKISIGISVESSAGNPAYASGVTAMISNVVPAGWRPTPTAYSTVGTYLPGNQSAATGKLAYVFARPAIVRSVQLYIVTAPTGAALKVDVNKDGSTMCTTKPEIAISANAGSDEPDAAYDLRCFHGADGATTTDALLTTDIDQIGSTVAGANLAILVRFLEYLDPFDSQKAV